MTQKIQLRRDGVNNWSAANPTLASGEIGIEIDNLASVGQNPTWLNNGAMRLKVGDAKTPWATLPYSALIADGTYAGAATTTPAVISIGTGAPTNFHGNIGDIYFRMDGSSTAASTASPASNTIYQCRGTTTTTNVTTLTGANTLTTSASLFTGTVGQKVQVTNAGNSGINGVLTTWIGLVGTVTTGGTQITIVGGNGSAALNATATLAASSQTVTLSYWVAVV